MLMLINGGEVEGIRLLSPASVNALLHEEWRHAKGQENGNNDRGLFNAWGLGVQKFLDLIEIAFSRRRAGRCVSKSKIRLQHLHGLSCNGDKPPESHSHRLHTLRDQAAGSPRRIACTAARSSSGGKPHPAS